MSNKLYTLVSFILFSVSVFGQTLSGNLYLHVNQDISLTTFKAYDAVDMTTASIDSLGNFTLALDKNYTGVALLQTQDWASLPLLLTGSDLKIKGSHLNVLTDLTFTPSLNSQFIQYSEDETMRKRALSAWDYLLESYQKVPLFSSQDNIQKTIIKEQNRITQEETLFIESLGPESYLRWFIMTRKFFYAMVNAPKTPQKIPELIEKFRTTDFSNPYFTSSSLFRKLIELHYQLLSKSGESIDLIAKQMNISTQIILDNLQTNPQLLNAVSNVVFDYFEQNRLFTASEYLALNLLSNTQFNLDDDLSFKLETYRKLKIGATAPDFMLSNSYKLSTIKSNKLLVFGISECDSCKEEYKKLLEWYPTAQADFELEVVYVSLDVFKEEYQRFYKDAPFMTYCDTKGFDSPIVKDYFINGTPTYFLLDDQNSILLRPSSIDHTKSFLESKL